MILAALLLFSFIIGLTPSGLRNVFAEELNTAPISETAAAVVESPVEPILPQEEIAPPPAEVVVAPVEVPPEVAPPEVAPPEVAPPEVVTPEVVPTAETPVEVIPPVVEVEKAPDPLIEEPIAPVDIPLEEKAPLAPEIELAAAPEVGILAVPTGGDYTLDWAAADARPNKAPYLPTYNKLYPAQRAPVWGRQSDPLPNAIFGDPKDAVEALEPTDLMLGQIVPFELLVTVKGTGTDGEILVTPYWLTKTTNGENFGFDPEYMVYAAFVDTSDTATFDPGGNATATVASTFLANEGTSNEEIQGTLRISGLDGGDKIVVEIWVVLKSELPAVDVSGTIQTGMLSATAAGETINVGGQVVPLNKLGLFEKAETEVSITKADSPDPLFVNQNLTYKIIVKNNSLVTANGIVVIDTLDSNVSFVSATGGGIASGQDANGYGGIITWPAFSLSPTYSPTNNDIEFTVVVHVSPTAPTENFPGVTADTRTSTSLTRILGADISNIVRIDSMITDDTNEANNVYQVPTNVLRLAPTSLILNATKILTGKALTAGMFTFRVLEGTTVVATGTNDVNGNIAFTAIQYTVAGNHTYTVEEVIVSLPGITYHTPLSYTVTVSVVDNLAGSLVATPTYPTGGVVFNNSYTTGPTSVTLMATKALTGRTLAAGMFDFELRQITTEGSEWLQTKPNGVDGNVATISFDPIEYTFADRGKTFNYTITEIVPDVPEPGMVYDTNPINVSVVVTDNGNGTLTATPSYSPDSTFNNAFKKGNLEVKKVDDAGNPILNNEATFELRQGSNVIVVKTSLTTGIASFNDLLVGTYTLVETIAPKGFELNSTVYTVIVRLNASKEIEVIVKTGGVDGTVVPSAPLVVTDKKLGSIVIEKRDSVTNETLTGAEFDLYREVPSGTEGAVMFTMLDNSVIYGIKVNAVSLVTGADGKTPAVGNLIQGNYFAVETKVPVGYKLLLEPVKITLLHPNLIVTTTIKNVKAPELPQTGGVGTMVFSIAGIGLMIGALFAYKKYNSNERIK